VGGPPRANLAGWSRPERNRQGGRRERGGQPQPQRILVRGAANGLGWGRGGPQLLWWGRAARRGGRRPFSCFLQKKGTEKAWITLEAPPSRKGGGGGPGGPPGKRAGGPFFNLFEKGCAVRKGPGGGVNTKTFSPGIVGGTLPKPPRACFEKKTTEWFFRGKGAGDEKCFCGKGGTQLSRRGEPHGAQRCFGSKLIGGNGRPLTFGGGGG